MEVDQLLLGGALGVAVCAAFSWLSKGFDAALDRQLRIARARVAAKRAERDRIWAEQVTAGQ